MTENSWIEHDGRPMPVAGDVCVHFRTRWEVAHPDVPITEDDMRTADSCVWRHEGTDDDILKYRPVRLTGPSA